MRNWVEAGKLPALQIGPRRVRITAGDLEAFVSLRATTDRPPPADTDAAEQRGHQYSINGDVIRVEVPGLTSEERRRLAEVLHAVAPALAEDQPGDPSVGTGQNQASGS